MLLKAHILGKISKGEITMAFRRWRKPTVKAGTRLHTAAGVLPIDRVEQVEAADIAAEEVAAAGFADLGALLASLGDATSGTTVYRITFSALVPDSRVALSSRSEITPLEEAALISSIARWNRTSPGYPLAILQLIAERPACPARELAASLGVEKLRFKADVRRLKALGLTESLPSGYRLSPRGESALRILAALPV